MAGLGYVVYLVSASTKGARLIGSRMVVVRYTSRGLFTVVPSHLLCSPTYVPHRYTPQGHCAKHLSAICLAAFRDKYRNYDENTTPTSTRAVLDVIQQHNVTKMEQPARSPDNGASMPRRLAAIIAARGGNTRY